MLLWQIVNAFLRLEDMSTRSLGKFLRFQWNLTNIDMGLYIVDATKPQSSYAPAVDFRLFPLVN